MSRIHQLDTGIVNKIAAGEVIERPANVVKELLENAIDALATRVAVEVEQGGSELMRVVDDGEGIHPDDLLLSLAPHATSKIVSADDLFRVQTMGFRGEALASIAEVSHLIIRSRRADAVAGVEVEAEYGQITKPQPCGSPTGTTLEVRHLFANTPVRRKFLKTTATEFGHISEHFTRIALANPRLHMTLKHNQKSVFELPSTHRLVDRLGLFYGGRLAESLIWVESESDDVRMWGYVAHPTQSKATRKGQYIFLNGRWIQDRTLQHALREAYRGMLMTGRQPIAFLFLEMPPDSVDVNVHPTKAEVRFRDSQRLYRQLLAMLRTTFLSTDLDSGLSVQPEAGPDRRAEPGSQHQRVLQIGAPPAAPSGGTGVSAIPPSPWSTGAPPDRPAASADDLTDDVPRQNEGREQAGGIADADISPWDAATVSSADTASEPMGVAAAPSDSSAEVPQPVSGSEPPAASPQRSSMLSDGAAPRAMQIHDRYLVVESDEGLTVVDQHALHERILYDQMRERILSGSVESQRLLVPKTVELSPREASLLLEHSEILAKMGFPIEEFGGNTILLNGYPAMLRKTDLEQLVRDLAERLDQPETSPTRRDILDELLHTMACKAAIKAGQRLTPEEINSLLAQRNSVDDAHHCPHGRPTALVLTQAELDRQFGRV